MTDYDSYIRSGEPDKADKAINWSTAIGLQQVDGLKTSEYLGEIALRNIEGEISAVQAQQLVSDYYQRCALKSKAECDVEEADRAAVNINLILAEPAFSFSVTGLKAIHRRIFKDVFSHAGKFRDYNITKKEWVLRGATVIYGMASELKATVEYDIDREKAFDYNGLSTKEIITHIARFIADLWQIHPFGEGNTRTTAVFLIKYLRGKGYDLNNNPFKEYSWYFRNALVRANYSNLREGVTQNYTYLERFLSNILLGTDYQLKNRYMHLDYKPDYDANDSGNDTVNDSPVDTVCDTVNSTADDTVFAAIAQTPSISYDGIAAKLGVSRSTVARRVKRLVEQGLITRVGSDKTGHWQINAASSGGAGI